MISESRFRLQYHFDILNIYRLIGVTSVWVNGFCFIISSSIYIYIVSMVQWCRVSAVWPWGRDIRVRSMTVFRMLQKSSDKRSKSKINYICPDRWDSGVCICMFMYTRVLAVCTIKRQTKLHMSGQGRLGCAYMFVYAHPSLSCTHDNKQVNLHIVLSEQLRISCWYNKKETLIYMHYRVLVVRMINNIHYVQTSSLWY